MTRSSSAELFTHRKTQFFQLAANFGTAGHLYNLGI